MNNKEKFTLQDFLIQLEQIDYFEITKILFPLIVSYTTTSKVLDSYTLHKEYKPKNIKRVNIPPELKLNCTSQDIKIMVKTKFSESLKKFVEVMIQNFSKEDLINFYNNINTLKISYGDFKFSNFVFRDSTGGAYYLKSNTIKIEENNFSNGIYHELLHMASSIYKDGIRYSGFRQSKLSKFESLGVGLNEGYTELLHRRYFAPDVEVAGSYEYEFQIADRLEKIVGKEKMESLYLNANLYGLIQMLKQYITEEEIMEFISSTDFVYNHLDNQKLKLFEKGMTTKCLKSINKFLIKVYSKKMLQQYQEGTITYEQLTTKLAQYVSSLTSRLKVGKNVYEILSNEDILESFESIFGESNVSFETTSEENSFIIKK